MGGARTYSHSAVAVPHSHRLMPYWTLTWRSSIGFEIPYALGNLPPGRTDEPYYRQQDLTALRWFLTSICTLP
jgi:hypothetical protein